MSVEPERRRPGILVRYVVAVLGGVGLLALFSLSVYYMFTIPTEGRQWSQDELLRCSFDASCDESEAAQEAEAWETSERNRQNKVMGAMFGAAFLGAVGIASLTFGKSPPVDRWFKEDE